MNRRTFFSSLFVGLAAVPMAARAAALLGDRLPRSTYDTETAPPEFVKGFVWWACQECPNQQYVALQCGAHEPVFTESYVSENCMKKITAECDAFWREAKPIIRALKGRCNWSPLVDTDKNHIGQCGSNFYFARHGKMFFMQGWPQEERDAFCDIASRFPKIYLQESNGQLEYGPYFTPAQLERAIVQRLTISTP